jgi:hypothetical protein
MFDFVGNKIHCLLGDTAMKATVLLENRSENKNYWRRQALILEFACPTAD